MNKRLLAIQWWNSSDLGHSDKVKLVDDVLGDKFHIYPSRTISDITGREVEIIYNHVHFI